MKVKQEWRIRKPVVCADGFSMQTCGWVKIITLIQCTVMFLLK